MTVCVAALCQIPNTALLSVVGASDRMLSTDNTLSEPNQSKFYQFGARTFALVSGDVGAQVSILRATTRALAKKPELTVEGIANAYADQLLTYHSRRSERQVLSPYGLKLSDMKGKMGTLPSDVLKLLAEFYVDAMTIIAGIDDTGGHLFRVYDPGIVDCCDGQGFATVGIGTVHADSYLYAENYSSGLAFERALYLVYAAKRRGERAPYVGRQTDLLLLGYPTGYVRMGTKLDDEMKRIYDEAEAAEDKVVYEAGDKVYRFCAKPSVLFQQIKALQRASAKLHPSDS